MSAPDAGALASESCQACRPDSPRVEPDAARDLLSSLTGWTLVEEEATPQLAATFRFADFAAALDFAAKVGALAEAADHHPRLVVEWGRVEVRWWTHAIGGLHRNDFILAARCSGLRPPEVDAP